MIKRVGSAAAKRGAPAIAIKNQALAWHNIDQKFKVLQAWVAQRVDLRVACLPVHRTVAATLKSVPQSRRQFNGWTLSHQGSEPANTLELAKNSNQTLNKHTELRDDITSMLGLVAKLTEQTAEPTPRVERLAGLRATLRTSEQMRQIAERELLRSREQVDKLRTDLVIAEQAKYNDLDQAVRRIAELEAEVTRLRRPAR